MSHYYLDDPSLDSSEFPISFTIHDRPFTLLSSAGVFSKEGLDTGTRILLEWILDHAPAVQTVLDLGCGTGAVGVVLSSFWHCEVTGIDPNSRACALAEKNYARYQVQGKIFKADHVEGGPYEAIVLNPPIRTGKKVIYSLFEQCAANLCPNGNLYVVIRKQHGAQSALDFLASLGLESRRVLRDKGFWVLQARRPAYSEKEEPKEADLKKDSDRE